MNKILGIVLLIIFVGLFYLNMNAKIGIQRPHVKKDREEITKVINDNEYPKTANDVVKRYVKLKQYIYSGKDIDKDFLEEIIFTQRKMFSKELFDYNSELQQNEDAMKEIEDFKENRKKILKIEVELLSISSDEKVVDIRTIEYLNYKDVKNYMEYTLILEDDKWKIYGMSSTEPFEMSE